MTQPTVSKVYNLIILDESGSMESIKQPTINGFNEILQSIRHSAKESPEIAQFLSFYSFNGGGIKELFPLGKVETIPQLNKENYCPDNDTPLYDAIGYAVNKLRYAIEKEKDFSVLVTILTDGEENSSKEYSFQTVAALIRNLRDKGWVFTYVGANHDVEATAFSLNITNQMTFQASDAGVQTMSDRVESSRKNYMNKIRRGDKNLNEDFFEAEKN
jgi:uncharacterized protein YegL